MKIAACLAAGVLLPFGLLHTQAAAQQTTRSVAEQYLFQAANAERTQRGLPVLRWDEALYRAATGHAIEMARRHSISHGYAEEASLSERCRQAGAHFSVIAENVAQASTAVRIHDAWMNSSGHRANMLDPHVDSVAVSIISRDGQLYAVQDFARAVADLPYRDQEDAVAALLLATALLPRASDTTNARRTCEMETGYAGARRPAYVLRYTTADLQQLPDALRRTLASGRYREADVGACPPQGEEAFAAYRIVVLLYP